MSAFLNGDSGEHTSSMRNPLPDCQAALYDAIAAATPAAISVLSGTDLRVRWANAAFCKYVDPSLRTQDISGMPLSLVLTGYEQSGLDPVIRHVAATRTGFCVPEFCYPSGTHGPVYWQCSLTLLPAPADAVPDILFHACEVTEYVLARKRAELVADRCRQERELIDNALSSTTDCNYILDLNHRFIYANQALGNLLGRPVAEIVGKHITALGHEEQLVQRFRQQVEKVIRTTQRLRYEMPFTAASGRPGHYEYILAPVLGPDNQVKAVAGSARDVTERKLAEQALQQAHDELERKVLERTAELIKVNTLLKSENAVRVLAEEALLRSKHLLQQLAAHQESIKEDERKRIAREIHDELGQQLLALRMDVSMLHARTRQRHPRLHRKVDVALRNIDNTVQSVRSIINNLRPAVLDLGLYAAIEWQVKRFEEHTGIACDLISDGNEVTLADSCTTALFRIVQESLTNISRHSHVTQVLVELYEADNKLVMKVSDNGIGIKSKERREKTSFGLLGIKERITTLGGELEITNKHHHGMTLTVCVPIQPHLHVH